MDGTNMSNGSEGLFGESLNCWARIDSQGVANETPAYVYGIAEDLGCEPKCVAFCPKPARNNKNWVALREAYGFAIAGVKVIKKGDQAVDDAMNKSVNKAMKIGLVQVMIFGASDGDYAGTAQKFRKEMGVSVGVGNSDASQDLRDALDLFVDNKTGCIESNVNSILGLRLTIELLYFFRLALSYSPNEEGFTELGFIGGLLSEYCPKWRALTKTKSLLDLMDLLGVYEIRGRGSSSLFAREIL